jgi:formylglycine-generating enzyme required for sulfatase activity
VSLAAKSRAQLVCLLATLPKAEWEAAAAVAGFVRGEPAKKSLGETDEQATVRPPPPPEPGPLPEPYRPSDLPDLPFWRVAAVSEEPPDPAAGSPPAWLVEAEPWKDLPVSDPQQRPPEQAVLVPRARQARVLRRQLAKPRGDGAVDVTRLCQMLAHRRLPRRLPRLRRPRWPARVDLLVDLSLDLRPFWDDFWQFAAVLRHILGDRLHVWLTRSGDPFRVSAVPGGEPGELPLDEGAVVLLTDAGQYALGTARQRRWVRFAGQCVAAGLRPLVFAPVPPRRADASLARWCDLLLWDRGAQLQPLRRHAGAVAAEGAPPALSPGSAGLLAALARASRVEPPLLRELRLALAERGTDIGSEFEVWHHGGVGSNILACALAADARSAQETACAALPDALRSKVAGLVVTGNRHQSPLVRAEEALAAAPRGDHHGRETARSLAATLHRGDNPAHNRELAGYVVQLTARRPELLGRNPELAVAWGLANREALRAGTLKAFPPGVDLASLEWLRADVAGAPAVFLGQEGERLGVYPATAPRPACRLAEVESGADYWQIEHAAEAAGSEAQPQVLKIGESWLPPPDGGALRLRIGRRLLDLETVRRPEWAAGIGRCAEGLFVELADGRRAFWVPMTWAYGGYTRAGTTTLTMGFRLGHRFWWSEDEYLAFLAAGEVLHRPEWAVSHGSDASGYWAEFAVGKVVQRMRWIPPGEFLMGSPEDEPERFTEGEWAETPHRVILTRGFWLADTACTQALWEAVMGKNPSHFTGAERPVEQVSWEDVAGSFLPALDKLVPGLAPVLPSEAQWEYACRAGTTTPFWFGETISPYQVNFNGNYPYGGGATVEYREQTVKVKALPPNGWGLYQMHGNVWEWCADWHGAYPKQMAVDPVGTPEGRKRVLRGGCWHSHGTYCRSAFRDTSEPGDRNDHFGFRLARGLFPGAAGQAGSAGVAAGGAAPAAAPDSPARGRRQGESAKTRNKPARPTREEE